MITTKYLALAIYAAGLLLASVATQGGCPSDVAPVTTLPDRECWIGFRAVNDPGSTIDHLIEIGKADQFETGGTCAGGCILSLGNVAAHLACQYGDAWYTRNDISWPNPNLGKD
jgi:hypothetical protein